MTLAWMLHRAKSKNPSQMANLAISLHIKVIFFYFICKNSRSFEVQRQIENKKQEKDDEFYN
jgi:hypothetical protein